MLQSLAFLHALVIREAGRMEEPKHILLGLDVENRINSLTPRRTLVAPFTKISILF